MSCQHFPGLQRSNRLRPVPQFRQSLESDEAHWACLGEEQFDSIEKQSGATIHSDAENSSSADDIAQITADDAAGDVIAIVGMGAKVPGADNIRDFWRLLQNGENHITNVPASRWNADAFYDKDPTKPGKAVAKQGGFVKNAKKFDNAFFEINDYEAASLDPQQSFVLECTHMALEDAGLTRSQISGSKTGVFIGAMTADHATLFPAWSPELDSYTATGVSSSLLSARVSYVYNLLGPSMVIDTACSSALVAIHQGIQAIRNGECDMAICGGVNYMGAPDMFVQLSKTKMLSPTGQSQAFSADADGYARGEGCGIVILKRLKDALQNSDRIWATIVSGVNQDGHTVTPVTSPSGIQQMALLREIYSKFNIDVSKLDYIEAHGTGTQAGDPVEVSAIGNFLKEWGKPRERYIGSVKTNIGHLEAASGVTAVIKVLLMMKHNAIVPSLLCDKVNPLIGLENFGFVIPTRFVTWENKEKMACCTSFGVGGTNSHVVLQAFHQERRLTPEKGCPVVVCFSGKTKVSLMRSLKEVQEMEGMCSRDADSNDLREESLLTSIAYTSSVRREHHIFRKAVVVDRMKDLFHSVSRCLSEDMTLTPSKNPRVVFVFCGMGTTRPGMLMQMMETFPVFKEVVINIDAILSQIDREESWSLIDRLRAQGSIVDPVLSPLAIFACQVALAALWKSLGINPDCVLGQSIGEVAAAYAAGCFSLETAVKIMFCRSKILADAVGGKMTVVKNLSVETVRDILREFENASIALEYSPLSCAVSADADTMTKVHQKLARFTSGEQIVQLIPLDVSVAYHSQFVDPCKVDLVAGLSDLESTPPKISYISAVSGEKLTTAPGQSYWVNHLREPVLFHQAVTAAWKDKSNRTVFVEIDPKQVLKAHIQDIFPSETVPVIGSMFKEHEQKVFLQAVVSLHELGADVCWKTLYNGRHSVSDIPRYVFDKKTCLKRTTAQALHPSGTEVVNHHLFLYPVVSSLGFKIVLSTLTTPFLYDHVVSHAVTVPGALYAEAGLALAKKSRESITQQPVVSATFISPLTATKDELIELSVTPDKDATTKSLNFSVKKQNHDIARIQVDWRTASHSEPRAVNLQYIRDKCTSYVSKQEIYSSLRTEGFEYGYTFSLLENAYQREGESLAFMKVIPEVIWDLTTTTIHPCVLDSMFQSVMFTSSARDTGDLHLLPQSVKQLKVFGSMETDMFVHSRLLHDEGRRTSFQLTLLSTDGRVLATVDELVLARLDVENRSGLPMLMSMDWIRVCQVWEKNNSEVEEALILATRPVPKKDNGKDFTYLKPVNHAKDWDEINQDVTPLMEGANQTTAVVVVCDPGLTKDTTGDELEVEILNTCGFIHSVLKLARNVNLVKPIYICTFGAWPASDKPFQMTALDPAATAVWGMVRTAVIENIYPRVAIVDIHMPANLLTANVLAWLLNRFQALRNWKTNRNF